MLNPNINLEIADNIFKGCKQLLASLKDYSRETESILINWIDSISLDFYLKNSERFSNFMAFLKTICDFIENKHSSRIWKKVILWINKEQRYDMLEEILKWSLQCSFAHEDISEINYLADTMLLLDPLRPRMIVSLLLLFGILMKH